LHPANLKTKYTKSIDKTGWLRIKLEPSGSSAYLCEFVKVSILKEEDRTQFIILEGMHKGKTASLAKDNASKCLVDANRGNGSKIIVKVGVRKMWVSKPRHNEVNNQLTATLYFNNEKAIITLDSDVFYTETNPQSRNYQHIIHSKPLPEGTYKIMVPEVPKDSHMTSFYATSPSGYPDLKYHTVWFPIENPDTQNSNFVHVGNLSEGCVTVYELKMWNPLYEYLISNRLDSEAKYVGIIKIE